MTTEELERLKKSIEEQGLEYHITDMDKDQVVMIIQKKDPWEGVEFCEVVKEIGNNCHVGQICKLSLLNNCGRKIWVENSFIKPSTEASYVEQLKRTAYEKFGEIKEGDRFVSSELFGIGEAIVDQGDLWYKYYKDQDSFWFDNVLVYKQGKWATKLPERVKVQFWGSNSNDPENPIISFRIQNAEKIEVIEIAKQLENYLNNEQGS